MYPEETKIEKDTCIPLFIASLFTIARTWKQPRCPSIDECIQKLSYIIHNGILLSHKKEQSIALLSLAVFSKQATEDFCTKVGIPKPMP